MKTLLARFLTASLIAFGITTNAASWESALAGMPLKTGPITLERTNALQIMLAAFQRNPEVKALVFMPGATDEFYFFKRARATVPETSPTLLDAVRALTNQTLIRVTWQRPLLLLHTTEDPLTPLFEITNEKFADRLKERKFADHILYYDRDWDSIYSQLTDRCGVWFLPRYKTKESWHFYRHSLAGWDLNCFEALQAVSLSGQSRFTIERRQIVFTNDVRKLERARGEGSALRLNSDQK